MAVPAGTFQTYQAVGNAEDFEDAVFSISPTDTPFVTRAKRLRADNRLHQWQTDQLAAETSGNATIEGDDAAADTAIPTLNLKNYCQLMDRVAFVSSTQEAVKHYGRESEMAFQMAKRVKELKRDLEAACIRDNLGTAGVAASPALMGSLEQWLGYSGRQPSTIQTANGTSVGLAGGTTPGFTTAAGMPAVALTDATSLGTISETILKTCIANTYQQGGDPSVIMVPPLVKQKISTAFSGIATRFRDVKSGSQAQIIGGTDLYVSDFGEHELIPNRFLRPTTMFGLEFDYLGVAYLQGFAQKELAVTGHSMKRMVFVEATMVLQHPFAHFKIADINPAL